FNDRRLVGRFNTSAVKIMKQVHREPLGREHAGVALHAGNTAPSAVERDDGGNGTVNCLRQVGVEADGLAAALEHCRRLQDGDGRHMRLMFRPTPSSRTSLLLPAASRAPTVSRPPCSRKDYSVPLKSAGQSTR